jgi:hypothetical protein
MPSSFNTRSFISTGMLISVLFLPVSGILLHYQPLGTLTLEKHLLMSIHNMAATLFALFTIIHISLNWRPLLHHLKKIKGFSISKGALLAGVLVLSLVGLFSSHVFLLAMHH